MLTVICFSKDRPLQLQAYLESFTYFSGVRERCISIIFRESPDISYHSLRVQFRDVDWIPETDFKDDLQRVIEKASNYILFGCDDVFFKSDFDPNYCLKVLHTDPGLYAFSLRMGTNITGLPRLVDKGRHLEWNWQETRNPNWNYPWEVSGSIYRKRDVKKYLEVIGTVANPNYLEDLFYKQIFIDGNISPDFQVPGRLACFEISKCLTMTVNRVQEEFMNQYDDTLPTDIKSLYESQLQGKRISWESFTDTKNNVIHVSSKYFRLTSDAGPGQRIMVETTIDNQPKASAITWSTRLKIMFYQIYVPFKEQIRPFVPRSIIKWMRGMVR